MTKTKYHLLSIFQTNLFILETDIACSKGGNRDAMLALNSRDDSPSSRDSRMSFESGPSRRNSMGYCNSLSSLQRIRSDDSLETMDAFIDDVDDEPVLRRVPQSLPKQRDNCSTTQHNHLKTNNAWGKRAVAVLPRGQDA